MDISFGGPPFNPLTPLPPFTSLPRWNRKSMNFLLILLPNISQIYTVSMFLLSHPHSNPIILHNNWFGHASLTMFENLLWFPMALRIKTQLLAMVCKALHDLAPTHFAKLLFRLVPSFYLAKPCPLLSQCLPNTFPSFWRTILPTPSSPD